MTIIILYLVSALKKGSATCLRALLGQGVCDVSPAWDSYEGMSFSNECTWKINVCVVFSYYVCFNEFHLKRRSHHKNLKRETRRRAVLASSFLLLQLQLQLQLLLLLLLLFTYQLWLLLLLVLLLLLARLSRARRQAGRSHGQFSEFHVCFCGLDPGILKFETVRTNKQHICF